MKGTTMSEELTMVEQMLEQVITEQQEQHEMLEEVLEKLENLSLPGPAYGVDYES